MYFIDLDGTILNTGFYHNTMALRFFRIAGIPYNGSEAKAYKAFCQYWKGFQNAPNKLEIYENMCKAERFFYANKIDANDGAPELLKLLANKNEQVIVVTGSPQEHALLALDRLKLLEYTDDIITADGVCTKFVKEESECYKSLAEQFGVNCDDIILVDNDPAYCKAAKQAGCKVIGVMNEYYPQNPREKFDGCCDEVYENMIALYSAISIKM